MFPIACIPKSRVSGAAAPSYANRGGTGDRRSFITATSSVGCFVGAASLLIAGQPTNATDLFFGDMALSSAVWIQFDFGAGNKALITETTLQQQDTTPQGTWQWLGSQDGSTWTTLTAPFLIAPTTFETFAQFVDTSLTANGTAYRFYQLTGVSGTKSSGPFVYNLNFKIAIES